MSGPTLLRAELKNGIWEGLFEGSAKPRIEVRHLDVVVPGIAVGEAAAGWLLQVPIPPAAISDGVQTLLVQDLSTDQTITNITLIAGEPLDGDLRAEVDLLRAELDLLKRSFRQHCAETV